MNASGAMCGTCVLGPGRHSSGCRRGAAPNSRGAMAVLRRRLRTLQEQLAAAEAPQRKEIIEEKLSPKLRQELIWLMETVPLTAKPPCNSGLAAPAEARGIARGARYGQDPARVKANLWTMRTSKGDFFAARLTLCGVVMASRVTRCLREAGRLRQRLEDLGRAAVRLSPHFEGGFRQAVEDAGDLDDLGLNFRLVLDLRPWVGRRVQSPTIASVDALLRLRRRLLCSASGPRPWPALRQEWLSWMTRERRKRWRSAHRSQEEAELLISTAEASVPGRLKQRRAAGTARRTAARSAARLQRAARQAEEALQRVERGRKRKKI